MSVSINKKSKNFTFHFFFFFFCSLLLAICLLSFAAIFIRLSEREISASATIFNRFWIATIFLILWERITSFFSPLPSDLSEENRQKIGKHLRLLILLALVDLACILLWAFSLNQTSISNSNLLHNLTPIFATFAGWLWLNQSFNSQFIGGVILASFGASAIAFFDFQFGSQYLIGDSLALLYLISSFKFSLWAITPFSL